MHEGRERPGGRREFAMATRPQLSTRPYLRVVSRFCFRSTTQRTLGTRGCVSNGTGRKSWPNALLNFSLNPTSSQCCPSCLSRLITLLNRHNQLTCNQVRVSACSRSAFVTAPMSVVSSRPPTELIPVVSNRLQSFVSSRLQSSFPVASSHLHCLQSNMLARFVLCDACN